MGNNFTLLLLEDNADDEEIAHLFERSLKSELNFISKAFFDEEQEVPQSLTCKVIAMIK